MNLKDKIKVGQTVFVKNKRVNNSAESLQESKIASIGRKYFKIDRSYQNEFYIETGLLKTDWFPDKIYLSREEYEEERRFAKVKEDVDRFFRLRPSMEKVDIELVYHIIKKYI